MYTRSQTPQHYAAMILLHPLLRLKRRTESIFLLIFSPYQYRRSNHETVSKGNNYLGRCSSARCRMLAAIHKVPIILCSAATYMQLCATIGTFNSTSLPAYVCVHHLLLVIQICQYTTKRLFSLCTSNGDIKTTSHTELLISFLSTSRRFY